MVDYLDSFNDLTTAESIILSVSSILQNWYWIGILNTLPKDDISLKIANLDVVNLPKERILGILWNPKFDQITVNSFSKEFQNTKRGLLSYVSSIFDLLWIVNMALLEGKLLFQQLWQPKL